MVASFSPSPLVAFYLYMYNYNFQYLLPGYFQTWFYPYIFFFPLGNFLQTVFWESKSVCSWKDHIGVWCGLSSWGYIVAICLTVLARNLRVILSLRFLPCSLCPPTLTSNCSPGPVVLSCKYFLNLLSPPSLLFPTFVLICKAYAMASWLAPLPPALLCSD